MGWADVSARPVGGFIRDLRLSDKVDYLSNSRAFPSFYSS